MLEHKNKTFLVTGANTGIGYETAKAFAELGGRVILGVRNVEAGEEARDRIKAATGKDDLKVQKVDLADLSSIKAAAEALADEERLDVLVNNAGLGHTKKGETKDGFELVVGTNHIGTFALTEALMGKLLDTATQRGEARVINLSSTAHQFARKLDPNNLLPEDRSLARDPYCESKLMNLLHVREMARRYGMKGLRAHAVHPGFVNSDFGRSENFPGLWQAVFFVTRPFQISPEKGAKTSVAAALSDDGAWNNGVYWENEKPSSPNLPEHPERLAKALWEETERLLAAKGFKVERGEDEHAGMPGSGSSLFPNAI